MKQLKINQMISFTSLTNLRITHLHCNVIYFVIGIAEDSVCLRRHLLDGFIEVLTVPMQTIKESTWNYQDFDAS